MSEKYYHTYVLGITGQAGAGKSTLAKAFLELGAVHIDADQIARELTLKDNTIICQIKNVFGSSFFDHEGQLKRRELGQHVFNDYEALNQLNVIIWPSMIQIILDKIKTFKEKKYPLVILDMAVLFEADMNFVCDQVIAVVVPQTCLRQRMKNNRGWSDEEITRRLEAQQSNESFRKKADIVVENDGDMALLDKNARDIYCNLGFLSKAAN